MSHSRYLPFYLSIYLSIYLFIYLSIYLKTFEQSFNKHWWGDKIIIEADKNVGYVCINKSDLFEQLLQN